MEVNIREGRRREWGHPERIALPTLREKCQVGAWRPGRDGRRVREAVCGQRLLASAPLSLSPMGQVGAGVVGSSAFPRRILEEERSGIS